MHVEQGSNVPVVLLREIDAPHRVLPIHIGGPEAAAIAMAMTGHVPPRPLAHDVMAQLVDRLFDYLTGVLGLADETVRPSLLADYQASGARGNPNCLRGLLKDRPPPLPRAASTLATRQERHGQGSVDNITIL